MYSRFLFLFAVPDYLTDYVALPNLPMNRIGIAQVVGPGHGERSAIFTYVE